MSSTSRRRTALAAGCALLMAALSACTLHADMTIRSDGTYDVVLEMRDTTGETITADTNCQDYANPEFVGSAEGTTVTATPIGSADDEQGLGCRVEVKGGTVKDSAQAGASQALVTREGGLYIVDLRGIAGAGTTGTSTGSATDAAGAADDGAAGADDAASAVSEEQASGALNEILDTRISVTFPGAVVDAGGGSVDGRTVTWTDTSQVMDGVKATGYASDSEGLSVWDRFGWWIIAGLAVLTVALGVAALIRRHRASQDRQEARRRAARLRPARPRSTSAAAVRKARRKRSRRAGRSRRS